MKKNAFTLAEGATHTNMLQRVGNGFTLAEVLITLAIIGVVAAMTIPTLIAKINSIVTDNQQKVFNAKLIKGLNLTKTAGDLNNTYTSTYDFLVNGLGKNLKMAKVCDSSHIRDCIPYDKITYENKSGKEKTINVADIKTVDKLNLKAPYMDPAAFVLADGTPVIVSYNKQCIDDPDKADTKINSCLAGIYDLNGSRKPNKYAATLDTDGKTVKAYTGDLRAFNGAYIGSSCFGQIGNFCIASSAKLDEESSYDEMLAEIQAKDPSYSWPKYEDSSDNEYPSYFDLASDYCTKVHSGRLPNEVELLEIANSLYDTSIDTSDYGYNTTYPGTMQNKDTIYAALGLDATNTSITFWTSAPSWNDNETLTVYFGKNGFSVGSADLGDADAVVCIKQ